jgi:hypothetical protein
VASLGSQRALDGVAVTMPIERVLAPGATDAVDRRTTPE